MEGGDREARRRRSERISNAGTKRKREDMSQDSRRKVPKGATRGSNSGSNSDDAMETSRPANPVPLTLDDLTHFMNGGIQAIH